jgi:tetratricopeptide (TPR) repeat protein
VTRRVLGPEYSDRYPAPIVGRVRELELLARVVAAAEGGSGGVALVEGDPGIGKTYVLEALAARAAGSVVLRGRAWEEGGTPPAWPWREVMRTLGAVVAWDHPLDRFAMFEQVATALRDASAAGPLLVLLDDLHAADDDALALTRYVAVSIREAPVALVLAGQPSPRLAALARDWVQVRLGPLSTAEILTLADQTAPDLLRAQTREDIVRIAEGNPLVAHELALAGDSRTGLPERLRDAVLARVAELAGPVREVLDAAAVLGRQFDLEDVAGMLGADVDDVIARLGASAGARLVAAVTGTGWQFRHQVIRDALYESVPIPARLELHAAAARHLAALGAELRLDEQARNLLAAVPLVDRVGAVRVATQAAAQAGASFAFGTAADILRDALGLVRDDETRLQVLLDLGDAQLQAGRVTDAWETFDRAGALAREVNDSNAAARALLGRTERMPSTSEAAELAGLVERALHEAGSDPSPVRVRLLARYASLRVAGGAIQPAAAAASEALAAARFLADDVLLCDTLTVRHITLRGPDDVEAAKAISDELVEVAARSGVPDCNLEAAMAQLVDQLRLGDMTGVDRTLERYRQLAATTGLPRYRFFVESRRGMRAFLAGRLAEGEAMLERARRIGTAIEEPDTEYVFGGARVMVLADLTDRDNVIAVAQQAEAIAAATGDSRLLIFAAYLRSSVNDHHGAAQLLEQALTPDFDNIARDGSWLMHMCMAAYVISRSQNIARARAIYPLLTPYAGQIVVNAGAVTFGGVVDHYLGLLAAALDQPETAARHLDHAIAAYQGLGATLFLARASERRDELLLQPSPAATSHVRRARLRRTRGEWECGYEGATFHLAHMVGLQHLARLLSVGGAEIHVLQLASPSGDRQREPQSRHVLLDEKAKAAYRERITDLREELQEADDNNDFERADHIRTELELIVDELRRAVGLGGRSRTVANDAERARVAVRKAIITALDRLAEHDSTFAQHLRIHIRTGIYCHYQTDPTNPIEWNVST